MNKIPKILTLLAGLLIAFPAYPCTNLIVGKKASTDGSVMITYNADDYGAYGFVRFYPAGKHQKGEMRKLYHYETNNYLGEIPEAEYTYNVVGQTNEHQLSIMETTYGGREELWDTTGTNLLDYGSLMYVTLQRAKTAREAIDVWVQLCDTYGYASEGESITFADPNDVWVMDMIGRGNGVKGILWVARRLPEDCITGHANQARITTFPLKDKKNCVYAKDVIEFAREKGYFKGKDKDFSFRDAYAPNDFGARRICDARVWSFFNRFCKGMDKYLPYAMGIEENTEEMPWCVKPDTLISLNDLKNAMRDHFEGTPLSLTEDVGAGPYNMPYRPTPLYFTVDGKKYFNERPISTQQTGVTYIAQLRSWLPNAIGGVQWVGCDDANMIAYVPLYCSITKMPLCFSQEVADAFTYSNDCAYWVCNMVSNFVYPRYSQLFPEVETARDNLDKHFETQQLAVEKEVATMNTEKAVAFLTGYSNDAAWQMLSTWHSLFERLVVKYNDMTIKPEKDGEYLRTPGNEHVPVVRPGYPASYQKLIIKETQNKYLVP